MQKRFVQAIILIGALGISGAALPASAQISQAQFSRTMDEALTEQKIFSAMNGSASVVVHVQGTASAVLDGLGRTKTTQLNSDPCGVDLTDTTYDALGRKSAVSNPYRLTDACNEIVPGLVET